MALDPRIALAGKPGQFSLQDFATGMQQGQQLIAGQRELSEQERLLAEQEAIRQAYATQYGGGAPAGLAGVQPMAPAGLASPMQERQFGGQPTAAFSHTLGDIPGTPPPATGAGRTLGDIPGQAPAEAGTARPLGLAGAMPGHMTPADRQGQRQFINRLYTISPKAGREAENHAYTTQKQQYEANKERVEYLGRIANGVLESPNPQQAWDVARSMLLEAGMPPGQVPEVVDLNYVRQLSGMALDAKDKYNAGILQLQQAKEQRERTMEGAKVPNYGLGQDANAVMHEMFGAQLPPGSAPSPAMTQRVNAELIRREREADAAKQQGRIEVAAATGQAGAALTAQKTYDAAVAKPLEGPALQRVNMLMQGEDVVKALQTEFTPEERRKYVGLGGGRMTVQEAQQLLQDASQGKADPKYARFAALIALGKQEAFSTAGQALSQQERDVVYGYIPTGKEWSAEEFEQKLKLSGERLPTLIDRELTMSTTPRSELREKRRRGEIPSMSPPGPAAATPAQSLTPMTEAMIADAMQQTQKSRAEVLDLARKTRKYQVPEQ